MALRELALAGRTLRKSPIFALTAALTIAMGVGASTAIFSVTNAVLLRPLPYKDPGRLVMVSSDMRNQGRTYLVRWLDRALALSRWRRNCGENA